MTVADLAVAAVKEVVVAAAVKFACARTKMHIVVAGYVRGTKQFVAISMGPWHVSETVTAAEIGVSQLRQIHRDSASMRGCLETRKLGLEPVGVLVVVAVIHSVAGVA